MKLGLIILALLALSLGEVAFIRSGIREPGDNVLLPTGPNSTLDTSLKYTPNGIGQPNSTAVIPHEEWATSAEDGGVLALPVTDESGAGDAFFGIPKGALELSPEKVAAQDPLSPL